MSRSRIDHPSYPVQVRQAIAEFLPHRGLPLISGKGRWSDRLLVIVMLVMVWSGLPTLADRFAEARRSVVDMYPTRKRPGRSFAGFMKILVRHSERLLRVITGELRRSLPERLGEQWRTAGWLVFTVDGTKIDCPRTRANQKHLPAGGKDKSGPQMLLVCLIHLGTGLLWSWRRDTARGSERGLLRQLLVDLPAKCLLVADAGFVGYEILRAIIQQGHAILMRVGANVHLLKELGYQVRQRGDLVYLWPQQMQERGQAPLVLRMITVTDGRNRRMCLLTSVLSEQELSRELAIELYRRRWGVELFYRSLKQILGRRKMLSDSPKHAQVELDWTVLGHWLLSLLLWQQQGAKMPPHQGLAQSLRIVRQAMRPGARRGRSLARQLRDIRPDQYVRRRSKAARNWPHKKNDPPCGLPQLRMASKQEVRRAKMLMAKKAAA
jgi:hypothetical protein